MLCVLLLLITSSAFASDELTVYELLAPDTHSFAIVYDTSTAVEGATQLFNPIRTGATVTNIRVADSYTNKDLPWKLVSGKEAGRGAADAQYLRVDLARPVPKGGEGRVRIYKIYRDAESYRSLGDVIVFDRSFTIKRNVIVLPFGYRLESCSAPAIVSTQPDGRLRVSAVHDRDDALRIRLVAVVANPRPPSTRPEITGTMVLPNAVTPTESPKHRAEDDKEITYWLLDPDTHQFRISHDLLVSTPGEKHVQNFVRQGSTPSGAAILNLDTGRLLKPYELKQGDTLIIQGDLEKPVAPGESVRVRITETYTDAKSYGVSNGELFWDRSLGRPRNQVVLPKGWMALKIHPSASLSTDAEGRVVLRFINPRTDDTVVSIRARR